MVSNARGRPPQFLRRVKNRPSLRRRSRIHAMIRALLLLALVGLLGYGAWAGYEMALNTPALALRRVVLQQVPSDLIEPIRARLVPHYGENLFTLDLLELQHAVEGLPEVRGASIRRVLPDGLSVRVDPRRPRVRLVAADGEYVIDRDGVVIAAPQRATGDLLSVQVGDVKLEARRGQSVLLAPGIGPQIASAVAIIEWLEREDIPLPRPLDHLRTGSEGVVLVLTQPTLEVVLGDERGLREKVLALHALLAADPPTRPSTVDVRYKDMLVVRELEEATPHVDGKE